ncbi:hypothetical protein BKA64DRAFT_408571 [Cadophora sp. MPI-SDFR-AT-0126]|nr:hypothetical protein BKA64DRAFT_408571 [Leotiomycetes sp. MPI-SDFR-AT-0126]
MTTRMVRSWLLVAVLLWINNFALVKSDAGVIEVTIERIHALDNPDSQSCVDLPIVGTVCIGSPPDIYAVVTIDGTEQDTKDQNVGDTWDISPSWKFVKVVDLAKPSITITIQALDADGFLRGDDDPQDTSPDGAGTLTLQLIPSSASGTDCQLTGPVAGKCGDQLYTRGRNPERVELWFHITIKGPDDFPWKDWDITPAASALDATPWPSDQFDSNHVMLNPRWGWQRKLPASIPDYDDCSADCTQQNPSEDKPDWSIPLVCHSNIIGRNGDGHLNWEPVAYTGTIHWESHSSPTFGDDDYNFDLDTPAITSAYSSGGTQSRPKQVHLEMKAAETIDHFGNSEYWKLFRDLVDADDVDPGDINGKQAVAVGLFGLDRVHPPSATEIHPLLGLAVHYKNDPSDDRWALFARNSGNEGMCSDELHTVDFGTFTFELPRPAGVAADAVPQITFQQFFGVRDNGITVFTGPGQSSFVGIGMSPPPVSPAAPDRVSGEIRFKWTTQAGSRRSIMPELQTRLKRNATRTLLAKRAEDGEPEEMVAEWFQDLSNDQKKIFLDVVPPPPLPVDDTFPNTVRFANGKPPPVTRKPPVAAFKDPAQEQARRTILNGFCGAYQGQMPADQPASCVDYPPFTQLSHNGLQRPSGWYTLPATVTLTAVNVNGRGIDRTEYAVGTQSFVRYSSPLVLPEGNYIFSYRSVDKGGVQETTKQKPFKIDTIPPTNSFAIGQPQYAPGPPVVISGTTPLTLTGSDSGSGVLALQFRYYLDGTTPPVLTMVTANRVEFTISGPDGVYQIDTVVFDIAGNSVTESHKVRVSHEADLAVIDVSLVTPPPPFIVVDSPVPLTVQTTVTNLGFVNPVDVSIAQTVIDTSIVIVTPKQATDILQGLGLNQPRQLRRTYTISCLQRITQAVTFTSSVLLSNAPGIIDSHPGNNEKTLTIPIVCKVPWRLGVRYNVGDEVVYNGLVYTCRLAHTSQVGWEPPNTGVYDLWQRIPDKNAQGVIIWAPQVIYNTGDVVEYNGHRYRARQGHQALPDWTPPSQPALWERID